MSSGCIQHAKRFLCVKKLTVSDGFTTKSVKLPRAEARFFMGELRNRQATPLVLLDEEGNCWELLCTCTGGQYALSHIGAFCEAHGARPGCYFIFYADPDHIVRLAVRQHLPEDVQAAIAAARAALAVRHSPLRTGHPAAAAPADVSAPLPASQPVPQPVLDEPTALEDEEMPQVAAAPAAGKSTASEPPRPMPLQDRSNLPVAAPPALCEATGSGAKAKPQAAVSAVGVQSARAAAADKENSGAVVKPANKQQPAAPLPPATPTGGLSGPAAARPMAEQQRQQQPASCPHPAPHSPPAPRSPASPPPSAPGTRLRMRFEARVRAQAGKLHPLSVRTGPESPPPLPPGCSHRLGFAWPAALPGLCMMQVGRGMPSLPWGTAGVQGHTGDECGYGGSASGGKAASEMDLHCADADQRRAGLPAYMDSWELEEGLADCGEGLAAAEAAELQRQLHCDERLDGEGGRRPAPHGLHAGADRSLLAAAAAARMQGGPHLPPQQAAWALPGSAASQAVHLALLRHLLQQAQHQQAQQLHGSGGRTGGTAVGGVLRNGHLAVDGFGYGPGGSPAPASPQLPQVEGPLTAASAALRKLLGMSPAAAAWDLAALSGKAGVGGKTSGAAPLGASHRPVPTPVQQFSDAGGSPQHNPPTPGSVNGVVVAAPHPSHEGSDTGFRPGQPGRSSAGCGDFFHDQENQQPQACGAAKPSLPLRRSAPCPPLDSPSNKRHCGAHTPPHKSTQPPSHPATHVQQLHACPAVSPPTGPSTPAARHLVSRTLTAHDLLTDRVALHAAAGTGATHLHAAASPGAPEAGSRPELPGNTAADSLKGRGDPTYGGILAPLAVGTRAVSSSGDGGEGGTALVAPPGCPVSVSQQREASAQQVPVDVVVESGARYGGVLLLGGGGASSCGCELHGLRPYLIRRQAGVGDVLLLWVDGADQVEGVLRLRAQLRQRLMDA